MKKFFIILLIVFLTRLVIDLWFYGYQYVRVQKFGWEAQETKDTLVNLIGWVGSLAAISIYAVYSKVAELEKKLKNLEEKNI